MATPTAAKNTNETEAQSAPAYRDGTKKARLFELLQSPDGVSVDLLSETLGWKPHTTRAALTGLRKDGHELVKLPPEEGAHASRYQIKV
ncbi:MAG: DUF3489 domain-containing protein [Oceanicaulis sp.]